MSTIKANNLTNIAGDTTVSMTGGSLVTNDVRVSSINSSHLAGTRNRIINGNFDIWQRGTSLTNQYGSTTYLADRWAFETWTSSTARVTYSRVEDAPPSSSYTQYSARITITSTSSNPTNDFGVFRQFLEGYNWKSLYQQPFVVSFWVKSSIAGTYIFSLYGGGTGSGQTPGTPSFGQSYTINAANTWQYVSIQVPACPAGTLSNWDFVNGRGLDIVWGLWRNGTTSGTLGTWNTSTYVYPAGTYVNLAGTLNATWQIAQVQVEPGTTATPFEMRSFGQELALCQRYYQALPSVIGMGAFINGPSPIYFTYSFPIMRTTPTIGGTVTCTYGTGSITNITNSSFILNGSAGSGTNVFPQLANGTASAEL